MSQQMFQEMREDGRSVLGMLAVQVERDPKTGATVVRSVAPVSTASNAPNATTIFDDGRKSIAALGRPAGQPSTEELGQILNAIDGVGMKVLLDEVAATPSKADARTQGERGSGAPDRNVLPFISPHATLKMGDAQFADSRSVRPEAAEECAAVVVGDIAEHVDHIEEQRLEEGPVTLMFLGYADTASGEDDTQGDEGGLITVERVMITEDGDEHVLGPQTSLPLQSPEWEGGRKSHDLQDVGPEENGGGAKARREEGDKGLRESSSPNAGEGDAKAKRKTCQCCSVM